MLNSTMASTKPGLGQVYSQGFGLENRSSALFGSAMNSESTVGDSLYSGSILGSCGKSSIMDFNVSGLVRRTSIAQSIEQQRHKSTLLAATNSGQEDIRESDSSLNDNDRGSVCALL